MDLTCTSLFVVYYLILFGGQAVGGAYFASVVNHALRPYFEANGMESEVADAKQAFGYLVASAVMSGLAFITLVLKVCRFVCGCGEGSDDHSVCGTLISFAGAIVMIVFACLTTVHAWTWWQFFAAEGIDNLAASCHGLAAMIIAYLVLSVVGLILVPTINMNKRPTDDEESELV
ncbi:hypothetical protein F4818DRAFT_57297 [Hypoxylon cercidicola]|nr:hypothetical protein F4818DRAFT_57297 [Hypoxylon cercidicola]